MRFADYYAKMSNDRNFKGQLECILNSYGQNPNLHLLELFAGQALHGIEASQRGNIDVWAIDSSEEMKQLALDNGFKNTDQYLVADLPEGLLKCEGNVLFDCVICLYHGLSNLNIEAVFTLLGHVKKLLNVNGKIFIELHNINKLMSYIENPEIHFEELQTSYDEKLQYAWPGGKIQWSPYSYEAEVPIKLNIKLQSTRETIELTSRDYIYSADEIKFLAHLLGYKTKILTNESEGRPHFGNSVLLELSI
ncbi:class I SAM-dependent methyltransferase [Mucilaginibacter sp. UR6-11]|uniref:class I SAM-dependent methyltransferase n=1 Tax=Mucilaginibacter sp. UR6-11 TaxID=1435644 RepID=UPI001E4BDCFB|nr:hypothetical protein [Mucilaginibacter sp. UR6-11]MCC8423662.1 hypothetical protein [Mucilaginibacter sp. UR6-11]